MQARAELGMRLLSDHGRRFGLPAGAGQVLLLHRPNLPSRVAARCDGFVTFDNHAPECMAVGTVWMQVVEC